MAGGGKGAWGNTRYKWDHAEKVIEDIRPKLKFAERRRILVLGNTNSGKSSLINQIHFVYKQKDFTIASTGGGQEAKTRNFSRHQFLDWNIDFIDSPPLSTDRLVEVEDLILGRKTIRHHTDEGFILDDVDDDPRNNIMHGVIYVCKYDHALSSSSDKIHEDIKKVIELLGKRGMTIFVVLTHLKGITPKVKIRDVFYDKNVEKAVTDIAKTLNMERDNVYPVWIREPKTEEKTKVLQDMLCITFLEEVLEKISTFNFPSVENSPQVHSPWLETGISWNRKGLDLLLAKIKNYRPIGGLEKTRILLIGNIRMGKSSFINSIFSGISGEISTMATAGTSESSTTSDLTPYNIPNAPIQIIDSRGLKKNFQDEDEEFYKKYIEFKYVVERGEDGDLKRHKIGEKAGGIQDRVHCVAFVLRADFDAGYIQKQLTEMAFEKWKKFLEKKGMNAVIVVTMFDKLVDSLDLSTMFTNRKVERRVKDIERESGTEIKMILPMVNECKGLPSLNKRILALYNLDRLLGCADDYISMNIATKGRKYYDQGNESD